MKKGHDSIDAVIRRLFDDHDLVETTIKGVERERSELEKTGEARRDLTQRRPLLKGR